MLFSKIICFILLVISSTSFATVESYFNQIKKDPNALYVFLKKMPKGGELHYHLAGGAYPETMLDLASKSNYCLNPHDNSINKIVEQCDGILSSKITENYNIYQTVIRSWSMKDFIPNQESGHDHFFNSFNKFMPIVVNLSPELLIEVINRAFDEQEQYLEIMILPDNDRSSGFLSEINKSFDDLRSQLLMNEEFKNNIQFTINQTEQLLIKTKEKLGCFQKPQPEICQVQIKFQYYVLREQPLPNLFSQALNGFEAVSKSNNLVGINLVQPEDGLISLRDYHKQMEIFNYLHTKYPNVHISLHAGELKPADVKPSELTFHITEAIHLAHAERIGHGVSIAYESNASNLLNEMSQKKIAVEINLTSNEKILNISGASHPLQYYLSHHVPVVLSTDDEGILRTTLTREYQKAVLEHGIDYPTLKMINRNALTYSFLKGKSLWEEPTQGKPVIECTNLESASCLNFIKRHEKAMRQWQLEKKLKKFENDYSVTH